MGSVLQLRNCVCGGWREPLEGRAQFTYFVQRQEWVKIGRTNNLAARLAALRSNASSVRIPSAMRTDAPLNLQFVIEGDVEHGMHRYFARWHVTGEWFLARPVLSDLLVNWSPGMEETG